MNPERTLVIRLSPGDSRATLRVGAATIKHLRGIGMDALADAESRVTAALNAFLSLGERDARYALELLYDAIDEMSTAVLALWQLAPDDGGDAAGGAVQ